MEYKYEITREDERFVYGKTYVRQNASQDFQFSTDFMRYKHDLWFTGHPQQVLARLGIETTMARADEAADLISGDLNGWYYIAAATPKGTGDEALKWIMGPVAAALNERGMGFERVGEVIPADYLATFVEYLLAGKFEKSFARDVFSALIAAKRTTKQMGEFAGYCFMIGGEFLALDELSWEELVEHSDNLKFVTTQHVWRHYRIPAHEILDEIISDPRFKAADASEIDAIIEDVIQANPDNASKVAAQPKLVQWFVGQVMKAAKGKAPAPVVLEKLKTRFGVE